MTALGNPLLLERVSSSLIELKKLFKQFDLDGTVSIFYFQHAEFNSESVHILI